MLSNKFRNSQIQFLISMAGSIFCLFMAGGVRGQEMQEPSEKGSFLLRPETTFQHYCAPCHGETAQGDGLYFGFGLEPFPRDLTDAEYMNTRTDEQLIAAISGGTASIGKSNLCPPWGKTLGRERIEGIVRYLRSLSHAPVDQDTTKSMASMTVVNSVERGYAHRGSLFQLAIIIAISLLLIGTAWLQWRKL